MPRLRRLTRNRAQSCMVMATFSLWLPPSMSTSTITGSSTSIPTNTNPQREEDGTSRFFYWLAEARATSGRPARLAERLSMTHSSQGPVGEGANEKSSCITHLSNLSTRETLTLVRLYHSSPRSRHGSPSQKKLLKAIPASSLDDISQHDAWRLEMENVITNVDTNGWSFDIASCSSTSVGSM